MMKRIFLAVSLVLAVSSITTVAMPTMSVEAKTGKFTKKDVKAMKKGTFVYAKASVGDKKQKLMNKGFKDESTKYSVNFTQTPNSTVYFSYQLSLYNKNSTIENFKTVKYIQATYSQRMNYSAFNTYLKRVKKYDQYPSGGHFRAYQSGKKYILVGDMNKGTEVWIFQNKNVMNRFLLSAG